MASKGGSKGEGEKTKIRFIMLEAEGDAADLQQIAQAITNAVRPTFVQLPPAAPAPALPRPSQPKGIDSNENSLPFMQVDEETETPEPPPVPKRASTNGSKKRSLPTPAVIDDLNLTDGDVPLTKFMQEKDPTDHSKRYLVIAAWLKHHRQLDEINIAHIYTCYRFLHLNVVADIGSVFRGCKHQGWFSSGSKRGLYAINHIGLNEVNDMSNGE